MKTKSSICGSKSEMIEGEGIALQKLFQWYFDRCCQLEKTLIVMHHPSLRKAHGEWLGAI
jgi:Fe-S-cluster containining protein